MSQKREESPVKKTSSQVYEELNAKYGDDAITEALESEVEDAKQSEAEMINEDGAEAQVTFLLEEGMYSAERLEKVVEEFVNAE